MLTDRFFMLLVVIALVSIAALTLQEAAAPTTIISDVSEAQRMQQSRAADVVRWTAMGEYYQHLDAARSLTRSRAADTARWMAVSEYYQQFVDAQTLQRGRAADAVRWTAMAEYYRLISPTW